MKALSPAVLAAWVATLGSVALAADLGESANRWVGTRGPDIPFSTACGGQNDGCSYGPCCEWYGQVESLFLDRSNNTDRVTVIRVQDEATTLPGTPLLTTGDPHFNFEPGVRALVGWWLDECSAVELAYFGIFDWQASANIAGNSSLAIPGDLGLASLDFFAADQITLTYEARLHNAEFNYVRSLGDVSLLAGFRYLSLREEFNLRSTDLDTSTSDYNVRTTSDLCRFGGRALERLVRVLLVRLFRLEATGKAGLFTNAARQTQFVTDFPPAFLLRAGRSRPATRSLSWATSVCQRLSMTTRGPRGVTWSGSGVALAPTNSTSPTRPPAVRISTPTAACFCGVNLGVRPAGKPTFGLQRIRFVHLHPQSAD
jgi:hypothetical protein